MSSEGPSNALITVPALRYRWSDWFVDHEPYMWDLYWGVMRSVDADGLCLLDTLEFSDFVKLCKRHTSEPLPPPSPPDDEEEWTQEEITAP